MKLVNMNIINNNWLKHQINEYIYHILFYVSIYIFFLCITLTICLKYRKTH